jgi:molybdopterin synthase sulfur carrier subunit
MKLELKFFATFREAVGQKTIHREFDDGVTAGAVLKHLEGEFEGLEGNLLDENGDTQDMLSILKNGREIVHLDGVEKALEDGDTLSVFPPVAGG